MLILAVVATCAAVMFAIECAAPGRALPRVSGWWGRVLLLNGCQIAVVWLAAYGWDRWLGDHRLWDAAALGMVWGPLLGYLVITFIYYWWHRLRHGSHLLWRWLHQVHHSPQRLEVVTSFYKHPLEILINGLLSSSICFLLLGLTPAQTALTVLMTGLAELVYHWNVRTPHWLGWFFQRPEMHCLHHEASIHRRNYGDLPMWDLLFGTYANPRTFTGRCGFGARERDLGALLCGRDVAGPRSRA